MRIARDKNPLIYNSIITSLLLLSATILSLALIRFSDSNNAAIIFTLAVLLISRLTEGYLWGILSSGISAVCFNFFFTLPLYELNPSKKGNPVMFAVTFLVTFITAVITSYAKELTNNSREQEEKTKQQYKMLSEINTKLLSSNGLSYIITTSLDYISKFTKSTVIFYSKSPQSGDKGIIKCNNPSHEKILNSRHERFLAHWVFEHKVQAGVGTDFCGESSCIYLPLISHNIIWGVIGIYCIYQRPIENNTLNIINLMISQVAMSIERQHLSDSQHLIMVETEKEKMRANLLRAVSHDLRTPLTGMIGASETLIKNKALLSEEEKDKLIGHVYEDSNWLLHMVENLLSVTRIREGKSSVNKLPEPIEEVVSEAIMRVKKRYPKAQITVKVPDEFLMVPMDATLIEQVIMNLIENALIHSGSTLPIELIVSQNENDILFRISDQGMGIKEDRLSTLFDGYSHMDNKSSDSTKGIGIGLSICKTIINAHGGTIWAENQEGGGAVFSFNLPM